MICSHTNLIMSLPSLRFSRSLFLDFTLSPKATTWHVRSLLSGSPHRRHSALGTVKALPLGRRTVMPCCWASACVIQPACNALSIPHSYTPAPQLPGLTLSLARSVSFYFLPPPAPPPALLLHTLNHVETVGLPTFSHKNTSPVHCCLV